MRKASHARSSSSAFGPSWPRQEHVSCEHCCRNLTRTFTDSYTCPYIFCNGVKPLYLPLALRHLHLLALIFTAIRDLPVSAGTKGVEEVKIVQSVLITSVLYLIKRKEPVLMSSSSVQLISQASGQSMSSTFPIALSLSQN